MDRENETIISRTLIEGMVNSLFEFLIDPPTPKKYHLIFNLAKLEYSHYTNY